MNFLPKSYNLPDPQSNYMKFVKGENRFRILSSPLLGYEWWVEVDGQRKPMRRAMDERIEPDELQGEPPKHFWAMAVFDWADERIKILEITQKSIMRTLRGLSNDEDWGDPKGNKGYDIVVERTGDGLETRYQVKPKPKKELPDGVEQMYKDMDIDLEALFRGEHPIGHKDEIDADELADQAAKILGAK